MIRTAAAINVSRSVVGGLPRGRRAGLPRGLTAGTIIFTLYSNCGVHRMRRADQTRVTVTERQQRLCVWAGISFAPVFLVGFAIVAGFIPPPAPSMSADGVAHLFARERGRIRIGIWIATAAAPLLAFY